MGGGGGGYTYNKRGNKEGILKVKKYTESIIYWAQSYILYLALEPLEMTSQIRLLLIVTSGNAKKSISEILPQCEIFGGIRENSAMLFTDVMKGYIVMETDDWHS